MPRSSNARHPAAYVVVLCCALGATWPTSEARPDDRPDSTRVVREDSLQEAVGTPPVQIERLRARLRGVARARILTREALLLASVPTVSSEGIQAREITMRSGFTYRSVSHPKVIPWAEIESIQAQGNKTRNGAWIGALAGTLVGYAIAAHQPCEPGSIFGGPSNCPQRQITPVLGGVLVGALLGALVASRYERWQPIYP